MIRVTAFKGFHVAVFGLGASGLALARSLMSGGAFVVAWDDNPAGRLTAADAGIPVADLSDHDWRRFSALVLAPGVPLSHPAPHWTVVAAQSAGVPVIGDIELFCLERAAHTPDAPFIAITGTNGKSTTTALTAHVLRKLGFDVQMGGNIGTPILDLEPPAPGRVHVIEMSSFQIDLTPSLRPSVGVLLNITPDHLDRHGTMEHYAAVKERLVAKADVACIGVDDSWTREIGERLNPAKRYAFTMGKGAAIVPRLYAIGTTIFAHEQSGSHASSREIASLDSVPSLRGRHNLQNALAALTALRALEDIASDGGAEYWRPDEFQQYLQSFPGLAHRLERVGQAGRTLFINDSKATNADSTEKALLSWDTGIYWIAGGRPKDGGIDQLEPLFPRIAKAYLIGEATDAFATTLDTHGVDFERCVTLQAALGRASRDAGESLAKDPVVLLSPACASYDQFSNFEERGDAFRALVSGLPGIQLFDRATP